MKSIYIILTIILVGAGAMVSVFLFWCQSDWCLVFDWQKNRVIDSFEKCAAMGNPVMESYPRRCRAGDKNFTEIVPVGNEKIEVSAPLLNAIVQSPLKVAGRARGAWYFEASFPVKLFDGQGRQLAIKPAQAQSDWMTTEFVPFEVVLEFTLPQTATGMLVLEKDNPSGLPEFEDSISLPVRFK
ncbi:MAG: Gmad2 immunoglobulin-like domain-containing protein [Candidatus Portnoybacteria bacterium]|nr:Gmad2 immunoglobulin-like domain-containing protein [Candidatus Portnoybacteria bacterium]MDD4982380.1 Gmad2 immunoglobulin-like domain-containing protein [Candidatus Portnoybacteria bacterium]